MELVTGEPGTGDLRVAFDRRLKLELHESQLMSDARLLAFRELDDALGLTEIAGQVLADLRTGAKVIAHARYGVFQMAEVAVPRHLFRRILDMIDDLRRREPTPC